MFQKIMAYQSLLNAGVNDKEKGMNSYLTVLFPSIIFLSSICLAILGIKFSCFMYLLLYLMIGFIFYGKRVQSEMLKSLPVSDRFVVVNVVFVAPIYIIMVSVFVLLFLVGIWYVYNFKSRSIYLQRVEPLLVLDLHFLLFGIVFLCGALALHKSKTVKEVGYMCINALCLGVMMYSKHKITSMGYCGEVDIMTMLEGYSKIPMFVGSLCFMLGSILFSYNYGLYIYRHDLRGQRKMKTNSVEARWLVNENNLLQIKAEKGKNINQKRIYSVLAIVVCTILLIVLTGSSLGMFEKKNKINLEYTSIEDYDKWNTIEDEIDLWEDLRIFYKDNLIFPQKPAKQEVEYYCAGITGSHGDDWTDLKYYRILVMNLSKTSYVEEKKRVAGITYEYEGDEKVEQRINGVLKDTTHFPGEAYIACFGTSDYYEYAIFDDEAQKVIYLYATNPECLMEKAKGYNVAPKAFSPVITLKNSNTANKGYSIHSFYSIDGWYEEW